MSYFKKPKATDWTTVNKEQLDKLLKVKGEVRRVVIKTRVRISEHMKQFPNCEREPEYCEIIRNQKATAFDEIGEIMKGVSEDDN